MAQSLETRYGYFELKADLTTRDAEILEKLVARPTEAHEIVGDLVVKEGLTPSDAYYRVRNLLLKSMQKLDRGHA